jgi:hypothetical protein
MSAVLERIAAVVGAPGLILMRKVKAALDPLGIMNPGKVIWRSFDSGYAGLGIQGSRAALQSGADCFRVAVPFRTQYGKFVFHEAAEIRVQWRSWRWWRR